MGKTTVNVTSPSNVDAMVVAIVAVTVLGAIAVVTLAAFFLVAIVAIAGIAVAGATVAGLVALRSRQIEAQAALALWRRDVQVRAQRALSEDERHAVLVELSNPPTPRVALAMRRMQEPTGEVPRRANVTWKRR